MVLAPWALLTIWKRKVPEEICSARDNFPLIYEVLPRCMTQARIISQNISNIATSAVVIVQTLSQVLVERWEQRVMFVVCRDVLFYEEAVE